MATATISPAEILARLPAPRREAVLTALPLAVQIQLRYSWPFWARPNQLAPTWDWHTWLLLAGRGFGKSGAGAEQVIAWARTPRTRIALVGETVAELPAT